jgi:anti-sigma regulatory factor (Ser/Thr protein kinase)
VPVIRRRALPSHPRAATLARSLVAADCLHQPQQAIEAALLLTSELVGNAVRHGSPQIALSVDCADERIHVEVEDQGETFPRQRTPHHMSEGGRGLMLVQAYSNNWGVRRLDKGKSVWFTVAATNT